MRIKHLGIFGIISLLSYTAMVVFSPMAYPGYNWLSMAVSELSAQGAPSAALAARLNALFGPCALVSIMAVCVSITECRSKLFKFGIYCFTAMEWVCNVGYEMFPWVNGAPSSNPQNIMLLLTVGFVQNQTEVFVRKLPVLMPALMKYRHMFYKNSPSSTSCTA